MCSHHRTKLFTMDPHRWLTMLLWLLPWPGCVNATSDVWHNFRNILHNPPRFDVQQGCHWFWKNLDLGQSVELVIQLFRQSLKTFFPGSGTKAHPTSRFNCSLEILVLACLFTLMQRIKRIFVTQNRHKNCHSATGVVVWVNKCGDWSKLIEQLTNQNIMWKMCSLVVTGK